MWQKDFISMLKPLIFSIYRCDAVFIQLQNDQKSLIRFNRRGFYQNVLWQFHLYVEVIFQFVGYMQSRSTCGRWRARWPRDAPALSKALRRFHKTRRPRHDICLKGPVRRNVNLQHHFALHVRRSGRIRILDGVVIFNLHPLALLCRARSGESSHHQKYCDRAQCHTCLPLRCPSNGRIIACPLLNLKDAIPFRL